MKLDLNCIRDTLLTLEDWLILNDNLEFKSLNLENISQSSRMLKYSKPEIAYTIVILNEANFIKASITYSAGSIYTLHVTRLTYEGHQLLDSIRSQTVWDKIYSICEKTELKSITAIMEISDMLLPDTIKSVLHS